MNSIGRRCLAVLILAAPAFGADSAPEKRDWSQSPAVVDLKTDEDVFAVSDVHGGRDRLVSLLLSAGLIKKDLGWAGGKRVLVVAGDVIDKGPQSLAAIDLLIALETEASSAGGHVIVLLGNHEAEFLANPKNKKARRELDRELTALELDSKDVASGQGRYGQWFTRRPIAARVNGWFFAHGGNTDGLTLQALGDAYRKAVDAGDWKADVLVGKGSILEAQKWWHANKLDANLSALGAKHIVFGHDPGAFEHPEHIAQRFEGKLFRIDVGMSPAVNFSQGELLLIHAAGTTDEVLSVDADGKRTALWTGPR